MNNLADEDWDEDWWEGFTSVPLTGKELEEIKCGQRLLTDVDRRNLVREVLFLRYMTSEFVRQLEHLGETSEKNGFLKYAKFVLANRKPEEK